MHAKVWLKVEETVILKNDYLSYQDTFAYIPSYLEIEVVRHRGGPRTKGFSEPGIDLSID